MRLFLPLPILAIAGCTGTPAQQERAAAAQADVRAGLAEELAGLVPGEPVSCLPTTGPRTIPSTGYGSTLVYRVSDDVKYVTEAPGCEGVGLGRDILVTNSPIGRTCSGDIAQTIDRGSRFPSGSCSFGSFTPYRRP